MWVQHDMQQSGRLQDGNPMAKGKITKKLKEMLMHLQPVCSLILTVLIYAYCLGCERYYLQLALATFKHAVGSIRQRHWLMPHT